MFSQKKSFFKGKWFYMLLIGIFLFGYWINQGNEKQDQAGISTESRQPVEQEEQKKTIANEKKDSVLDHIIDSEKKVTKNTKKSTNSSIEDDNNYLDSFDINENLNLENGYDNLTGSYYLIKEVNGMVNVYQYDEEGNDTFIRSTDIDFNLLNEADQKLFQEGIVRTTRDELNELLQDFES